MVINQLCIDEWSEIPPNVFFNLTVFLQITLFKMLLAIAYSVAFLSRGVAITVICLLCNSTTPLL